MPDVAASRKRQIVDDMRIPDADAWMAGLTQPQGDCGWLRQRRDRSKTGQHWRPHWSDRFPSEAGRLSRHPADSLNTIKCAWNGRSEPDDPRRDEGRVAWCTAEGGGSGVLGLILANGWLVARIGPQGE